MPNTVFKADNADKQRCGLKQCYGDRPLAYFFRRKNEKNGFTIIYMYISI